MSKYTTEVRYICENASGLYESGGYSSINEILDKAAPKVFDFDFPIYDENYREILEKKILRHYYTREIGEETVGLWKLRLEDRMNIIMPYYNKLYESELLKFDPLADTNFVVKKDVKKDDTVKDKNFTHGASMRERENDSESKVDGTVTGDRKTENDTVNAGSSKEAGLNHTENGEWNLFSDTPQGGIVGIANAYSPNLADKSYLTDARNITGNEDGNYSRENTSNDMSRVKGSDKSTSTENTDTTINVDETIHNADTRFTDKNRKANNVEDYLERVTGKRGTRSFASILKELRETFLNIDAMIIDELSDLFMNLW